MLKSIGKKNIKGDTGTFLIIASLYNARYVDSMLNAAKTELKRAGAKKIKIIRVPGAYEIPVVAAKIAGASFIRHGDPKARVSAIICLGVILRGQTVHAEHIGRSVSDGLMGIQLRYEIPVIHEVLLLENEVQARVRCLGKKYNRGAEAAQTAIAMAGVMRQLET